MSIDRLRAIPGNESVYDELRALLAEKSAVAFVGAGASAGMYPLWNQFIDRLADYAIARGKATPKDAERWKSDKTSTPQARVDTILLKLEESEYRQFLKQTFKPAPARFTPTHAALLRLPFRGFVTTNYDPALDFARAKVRPDSLTTGTPTWEDEEVYRWFTGDVVKDDCPILWLHGYWQRPSGIVLNAGEYAKAYKPSLYRSTFKRLWQQDHLVFVGFGFNDPQFNFMVGEMLYEIAEVSALPRHVAILSIPEGTDADTIAERRAMLDRHYHVRPLFYTVRSLPDGGEDHSELTELFDHLVDAVGIEPRGASAPSPSPPPKTAFVARWVHETTNDDKFTGRQEEIERLDRWVRDDAVRVIGITAVGGTGKTALIGKWLKTTEGWRSRPFEGLFAWSFYQGREVSDFLKAFADWAWTTFATDAEPIDVLRRHPLILVLDGLEVLQEGPQEVRHGSFLSDNLRELLTTMCNRKHRSLAVLTSRFVFSDLERNLGTAFHQLELPGLTEEQGASLLGELEVEGDDEERRGISRKLDGHPLALRVFADALPPDRRSAPRAFLEQAFSFGNLHLGSSLNEKVGRLLAFYEERLPAAQVKLLGVVALFRSPVTEATVRRIANGLFDLDDFTVHGELRRLHERGIITREPVDDGYGYACHPILRDHFRSELVGQGSETATKTADLLMGEPSDFAPRSIKELEPVLLSIELLLDADDFTVADRLYRERLANGRCFQSIPAPHHGLSCALGFVRNEQRRTRCEAELTRKRLSFYLNDVGLFSEGVGECEMALQFLAASAHIDRQEGDTKGLVIVFQNAADASVQAGRIEDALKFANESLALARTVGDAVSVKNAFGCMGLVRTLLGDVSEAVDQFAIANAISIDGDLDHDQLHGLDGVSWAQLLLATGHLRLAKERLLANLRICEQHDIKSNSARCHHSLAICAVAESHFDDAEAKIEAAEAVFRRGHMMPELARLHITAGYLAFTRGHAGIALDRAAEALAFAQPHSLRLVHADALVLRGRARLLEGGDSLIRALDDSEDALRIARSCPYPWAERDALLLQADVLLALGRDDSEARREAADIAARLVLTEARFAEADAKAKAWLEDFKARNH